MIKQRVINSETHCKYIIQNIDYLFKCHLLLELKISMTIHVIILLRIFVKYIVDMKYLGKKSLIRYVFPEYGLD